ncbi:MAG: hypothetical protein WCH98_12095 [Verrucomicrobiota bacterium]
MSIELDTTKFDAALKRFRAESRRAAAVVLREQAKGTLGKIIEWTPPGGKNATGQAAKKRGEAKVESDILKLMQPWVAPKAPINILRAAGMFVEEASNESPAAIHKANRSPTGRVNRKLNPRIKIKAADLKRYIAAKKKMVGFLASGWKAAATKFGSSLPAWISRHSAPGMGKIKSDAVSIEVTATNQVQGAPRLDMERRVQSALDSQAAAMVRRVENFAVREAARKAGFRA